MKCTPGATPVYLTKLSRRVAAVIDADQLDQLIEAVDSCQARYLWCRHERGAAPQH